MTSPNLLSELSERLSHVEWRVLPPQPALWATPRRHTTLEKLLQVLSERLQHVISCVHPSQLARWTTRHVLTQLLITTLKQPAHQSQLISLEKDKPVETLGLYRQPIIASNAAQFCTVLLRTTTVLFRTIFYFFCLNSISKLYLLNYYLNYLLKSFG